MRCETLAATRLSIYDLEMASKKPDVMGVLGDDDGIDFHHPYTPYDVQLQFMRAAYDVLDRGDGQVGILESPTGTVSEFGSVMQR